MSWFAPTSVQAAAKPQPTESLTALDERSALKLAVASDARVEVLEERTQFSQIFAEPTGRLTFESTVVPKRTKLEDGSWKDVDLALVPSVDGTFGPKVSVADVRFSAGGSGPLVSLVKDHKKFTVRWPGGPLPVPKVAADSATYPEVFPGVDLVMRATTLGFAHVLAVKTAAAAANPALQKIEFDLGGDARVLRSTDGALQAVADGAVLASADAPVMWDSRAAVAPSSAGAARAARVDGGGNAQPSTPAGPGDTALVAEVATEMTASGDLMLKPDAAMLAGAATFPVFIDPAWSTGKSRWAYATNNNSNNTDLSVARVGADPDSSKVYRSFFEFPTTGVKAKHVESAYVQMKLDHSWSCTDTWTTMFHSGVLSATPRTSWSTSLIKKVAATESHANEGSGCADSPQPDMTVNFGSSAVTALIQSVADKGNANVTVGFSARNEDGQYETATDRWKKFFPGDARLIADIDAKPSKPNSVQVNGVECASAGIAVGVTNPYFSAVFPDGDGSQAIKGTWEFREAPLTGAWTTKTPPAQTSAAANSRATTARVSGAVSGRRYMIRTQGTDPAPYSITGDWSDPCYFTIDTTVPAVTAVPVTTPGGPGQQGTFRISSPAGDVTKFRYGWTEAVTSEVAATTVGGVAGKSATVTVTAPKYGINVLYLQAIDATNNKGYGSRDFTVGRPSPAVARWGLETYPGVDVSTALADKQPTTAGNTPLTASGITWADKGRLVGGNNASFAGSGVLATQAGVVNTTKTYAVAAWARLEQLTAYQTIVSQDGNAIANFQLQYRPDDRNADGVADKSWCFTVRNSDTDMAAGATVCALNSAVAGRWTHVAGGYDAATDKLQIWVDGVLKAEAAAPTTPWNATGPLRIGNRKNTPTQWLDNLWGNVADVQVYDRAIVAHDFIGQLATDVGSGGVDEPGMLQPIIAGRWDFDSALPCYDPAVLDTCEALDGATWGRRLRLTQGSAVGSGSRGQGIGFDSVYDFDDTSDPRYGTPTTEYGISQRNLTGGQPAQWQDGPVLRTDQSFTTSVWLQPSRIPTGNSTAVAQYGIKQSAFRLGIRQQAVGGVTAARWTLATLDRDSETGVSWQFASAAAPLTVDDTGDWTHLIAVYDTAARQIRLYVNGELAATAAQNSLWFANGGVSVGRTRWTPDNGTPAWYEQWVGGIDDLYLYQGALTSAQVLALYKQQAAPTA